MKLAAPPAIEVRGLLKLRGLRAAAISLITIEDFVIAE
jgi:hypothetical protein